MHEPAVRGPPRASIPAYASGANGQSRGWEPTTSKPPASALRTPRLGGPKASAPVPTAVGDPGAYSPARHYPPKSRPHPAAAACWRPASGSSGRQSYRGTVVRWERGGSSGAAQRSCRRLRTGQPACRARVGCGGSDAARHVCQRLHTKRPVALQGGWRYLLGVGASGGAARAGQATAGAPARSWYCGAAANPMSARQGTPPGATALRARARRFAPCFQEHSHQMSSYSKVLAGRGEGQERSLGFAARASAAARARARRCACPPPPLPPPLVEAEGLM